ncbi:MAG: basic amino acid ABC transporter substrate-binding protein [Actinomycetota bacterium]
MRRSRFVWLLAGVVALSLIAAACGGGDEPAVDAGQEPSIATIEPGVLTVGSDIPYPPFEFRQSGTLVGLDIDLINEIASRLGLTTDIIDTDFDTIFSQLATGTYDVVIAASTITPEREEQVDFSDPYYASQQSLTVASDSAITSTDDLTAEHRVGVQDGTTGEQWAEENLDGPEIVAYPEGPDGYTALEAGQVDAVINDEPTAIAEVANREGLELVEAIDTGEFYGIAVDPNNPDLLAAVNEALAAIIADGTYEAIYAKYTDLPPGGNIAAA